MAITRVGSAVKIGAALDAMPTGRQVGDLELMFAFRDGSNIAPTMPANVGWQTIATTSSTQVSGRLAYRWCVDPNDTSGTWTNATDLICVVYRGVKGIGGVGPNANVGTGMGYVGGGTFSQASGHSWVASFGGHRTASNVDAVPPTNTTLVTSVGAGPMAAAFDSNTGVSAFTSSTKTVNQSSGWVTFQIELPADTTIWSPYRKSSIILDVTPAFRYSRVTSNPGGSAYGGNISAAAYNAGKWVCSVTTSDKATGGYPAGFAAVHWNTASVGLGADTAGVGWDYTGAVKVNGVTLATIAGFDINTKIWLAIDLDNNRFWGKTGEQEPWNNDANADPDAGTGGIDISTFVHAYGVAIARGYVPGGGIETAPLGFHIEGDGSGHHLTTFKSWDGAQAVVLAPPAAIIAVSPGLAPVVTVSPLVPSASVALAGLAPTIEATSAVPTIITVPAGPTIDIAAYPPGIKEVALRTTLNVDIAALAPGVASGVAVVSPAADINIAALAPEIVSGKLVQAPAVNVGLAANAPTLLTGKTILPPNADVGIATASPVIASGGSLAVPTVNVGIAAAAPHLSVNIYSPKVNIAVEELAPAIDAGKVIAVPSVDIDTVPIAPTLAAGKVFDVPAVGVVCLAFAPVIAAGKSLDIPTVGVSLSGNIPSVATGAAVVSPAVALAVAAEAPSLATGASIQADVANVALAILEPDVASGVTLLPDAASITITASAPWVSVPATAAITIQAWAPTITTTVVVPSIQFILETWEPEVYVFGVSVRPVVITITAFEPEFLTYNRPGVRLTGVLEIAPTMNGVLDIERAMDAVLDRDVVL